MSPRKILRSRSRSLGVATAKTPKPRTISFTTPLRASEKLACSTCKRTFTSQLMFAKHKKDKKCVEPEKQLRKKTTTIIKSTQKEKNIEVVCDECGVSFTSSRILSQHKIASHSIKQNLTNVGFKKKKITEKFSGIPVNAKLKNAFAAVKAQTN